MAKTPAAERVTREYGVFTRDLEWQTYKATSVHDALEQFYQNNYRSRGGIRIVKVMASGELFEVLP